MKRYFSLIVLSLSVMALGCKPAPEGTPVSGSSSTAEAGDDHGHEEMGQHGGHMLHLEPTGAHAEWTHDDDAKLIAVHLDDFDEAKVSGVKFVVKINDASQEFPLSRDADAWTITSEELMTHINMGEAAQVTLVVDAEDGEQSTRIEAHEHHHH